MTAEFWFRTNNPKACIVSYATPTQPNTLNIFAAGNIVVLNF